MTDTLRPGTEDCGCCDGVAASTPRPLRHRPGLPALRYRIGDHASFRASLVAGLSSAEAGALAALTTRDADDFTLGLLDALACSADVLSFYQERLANESYLGTATERVSLQELGRLVGYQLRPGLAAETWLAFALEPPLSPPPGHGADPGSFVTGIPAELTLPLGLPVQSVPGPGETPQAFETVEPLLARPQWNAIRAIRSAPRAPGFGATEAWLAGTSLALKAGDALVLAGPEFFANPTQDDHWDFRLLTEVTPFPAEQRTRVRWARGLGAVSPFANPSVAPQVHVLRRRAAFFGHNAPLWRSMGSEFKAGYLNGAQDPKEWPDFRPGPGGAGPGGGPVDLDAVYGEVRTGSLVVLAKGEFNRPDEGFPAGTYVELYQVSSTTEVSRAAFAMSAKVSRLGLRGENLATQFYDAAAVRATSVFLQSEPLALAPAPLTEPISGEHWPLAVPADGLTPGRRCLITGRRADTGAELRHAATLVAVQAQAGGSLWTVTPGLPAALARDSVVVHANVALARHGATGAQILGSGDASQAFQRFELQREPLTWRAAATESGAEAELTLRVGDVAWERRDSLYGSGPTDHHYHLDTDAQGRRFVVFGDGLRGARLPSGAHNVRASARQGLGSAGNVAAGRLSQLAARPLGLKGVDNPLPASGGTDPEPADQVRRSLPLFTRTLGRVVSLQDHADFALGFAGIGKASARVLNLPAGRTVAVTVASSDGSPLLPGHPVWTHLLAALQAAGDPRVPLLLLDHAPRRFRLGLKFRRDPAWTFDTVAAAIDLALRQHFNFAQRQLGQPVYASDVIATLHGVPGVLAVDLDRLSLGPLPGLAARLVAADTRVQAGLARPAELLLLADGPLDALVEMS